MALSNSGMNKKHGHCRVFIGLNVPCKLSDFTDSDFSNLDSTSNPELSEAEELPHKKDVNFVDPGFCFADHG